MKGERSDEEKELLSKKVEELTIESEAQNKRFAILSSQLKKAQDDLRYGQTKYMWESNTNSKIL